MNFDRRPVLSSRGWVFYFRRNARTVTSDDFKPPAETAMPADVRAALAASLPAWQLGETSDGNHLRAAARKYSREQNDPEFLDAVNFFIGEEQRHGAALGDWLDRVGIPRKTRDTGDTLFRWVRHALLNYTVCAFIIVVVESMAEIYYSAVRRITPCLRLQAECDQILRDEVRHIQFQCEHLATARRGVPRFVLMAVRPLEFVFYMAVFVGVWAGHWRVLKLAGLSLPKFLTLAVKKFRFMQAGMNPDRYQFPGMTVAPARQLAMR